MDGYAVPRRRRRARRAACASSAPPPPAARFAGAVGPGEAVRIFTGAPVPDGADWIVIQEDAERRRRRASPSARPRPRPQHPPGRRRLPPPARASPPRAGCAPADLALLAAMNAGRVAVARRPVVALIPTGDELVVPGEDARPRPDRLLERLSGSKAMLEAAGAEARLLPIARDTARAASPPPSTLAAGRRPDRHPRRRLGRRLRPGAADRRSPTASALDFHRVADAPGQAADGRPPRRRAAGRPARQPGLGAGHARHLFLRAGDRADARPARRRRPRRTPARLGARRSGRTARARTTCAPASSRRRGGWRCTPLRAAGQLARSRSWPRPTRCWSRPPHDPGRAGRRNGRVHLAVINLRLYQRNNS